MTPESTDTTRPTLERTPLQAAPIFDPQLDDTLYPAPETLEQDSLDAAVGDERVFTRPVPPVRNNPLHMTEAAEAVAETGLPASPAEDGSVVSPSLEAGVILSNTLQPGEIVVHQAAISQGIFWKGIAVLLLALVASVYGLGLALFFILTGVLVLVMEYRTREFLVLAATDKRIILAGGTLTMDVIELPYNAIQTVDVMRTPPGLLFGYGNVILTTASGLRYIVPFVADASAFRDDMMRVLLARQDARLQA